MRHEGRLACRFKKLQLKSGKKKKESFAPIPLSHSEKLEATLLKM